LPDWEPGTPAILTTNGDLLYRNGAGAVTRLPIGAAGEVLTVVSSLPDWEAPGKVVIPIAGWVEDTGWTYASATTFTKAGDFTAIFRKGTKLRYKQGGAYKYAYVTASSLAAGTTTITCTGGSDYSLANAAITDAAYSHIENPEGFPLQFNYTPVWTGAITNPAIGNGTLAGFFSIQAGRLITAIRLVMGTTTTYGSGIWTFSMPASYVGSVWDVGVVWAQDTGTAYRVGAVVQYLINTVTCVSEGATDFWKSTLPFTWASTDLLELAFACNI
jgi:hypothetical protein